jgi:hypothetical protein
MVAVFAAAGLAFDPLDRASHLIQDDVGQQEPAAGAVGIDIFSNQ